MTTARSEMPAVIVEGQVYVLGGLVEGPGGPAATATAERYDPASDRWEPIADLPEPLHHLMAASSAGLVLALGGYDSSGFNPVNRAWGYNPELDGWRPIADLPVPVGAGAAAEIGGLVYVLGGTPGGTTLLSYDPVVDAWIELPPLSQPREHFAAAFWQGRLYAIGGRWEGEMLRSVEVYDPSTGSWTPGPDLIEARSGFGAAVTEQGVVVAGGEVFGPARTLDTVELLGNTWSSLDPLPVPLHGLALAFLGGTLYTLGGSRRAGDVENMGEVWAKG